MKIKLLIVLFVSSFAGSMFATKPDWTDEPTSAFQSTLLEARHFAKKKDRPYMIIFQADWCTPCKWMDKFTLSDVRVQQYLLNNYSAVKMDIDEFEGFALKEQYEIKLLPTILFFDRNNEIIGRYENTYDVNDFLKILDIHKNFAKQNQIVHRSASSPVTISADKNATPTRRPVQTHTINTTTRTSTSSTHSTTTTTPTRRPVQHSTSTPTSRPVSTTSSVALSMELFTIQIGAFNNYDNADNMIKKMSAKLQPGQTLRIRQIDNKKYPYRVTVGEYYSQEEASAAMIALDQKGIKGLLKRSNQIK